MGELFKKTDFESNELIFERLGITLADDDREVTFDDGEPSEAQAEADDAETEQTGENEEV